MENENIVTIKHHLLEKELLREEGYSEEEDEGDEEEKEKEKESDCFLICWFFFSLSVKHLRGTPLLRMGEDHICAIFK